MKKKIHLTERYRRERQQSPKKFDPRSFRVIDPGRPGHTKMIVACPKGFFKQGKCRVGMRVQAVLKEKKKESKGQGKNPESRIKKIARRYNIRLP